MIVQELHDLYGRLRDAGELPPYGFSEEKVTGRILLRPDGGVAGVMDMRLVEKAGRKELKRPRLTAVPQPPAGRTSGIKAGFLYDNAQYLFGHAGDPAKAGRAAQCFAAAAENHARILDGVQDEGAAAVLAFFSTWQPGRVPDGIDPELLAGFLVFALATSASDVHEAPAVRAAWERALAAEEAQAATGQCLVTGGAGQPIARIHPAVKGVPGAQTSGAALVSFNADAWTSYGKGKDSLNAPMSQEAAHGYTAALNWLLARRGQRHVVVGAVSTVFWADRPAEAFDRGMLDMLAGLPPADPEDLPRVQALRDSFWRLARGERAPTPEEREARFFVLGLSPNAARLAVRFWVTDTLPAMAARVARHDRDLRLAAPWREAAGGTAPVLSVYALAMATKPYRRDGDRMRPDPRDEGLPHLHGDLLRAVLTGGAYPDSLAAVLLDRFRADRVVNHPRAALLKAWLVRRRRIWAGHDAAAQAAAEAWGDTLVQLDTDRTDPGYLLGRLFATLEKIQAAAAGREVNATIKDKYISAASGTPGAVFPRLLTLSQHHLKKARRGDRPGWARSLETQLGQLMQLLDGRETPFPRTLDMEQRGLFFLGYYHEQVRRGAGQAPPDAAGDAPDPTDQAADAAALSATE